MTHTRPSPRESIGSFVRNLECLKGGLVVVTVDAQQLPIAAIGRGVVVIVVFVVNREFSKLFRTGLPECGFPTGKGGR